MRRPGEFRNVVFTPARIAAGLPLHFEQHKIMEAALVQMPRGIQAGHAASDDHDWNAQLLRRRAKSGMIAQPMPKRKRIVDEPASNLAIRLAPQSDQRRCAEKRAPRKH